MWITAALGGVLVLALAALRRRLFAVTVRGASMEPVYVAGERLIARRVSATALRRGQIVILDKPLRPAGWEWSGAPVTGPAGSTWMIKRVAAVPGDPLPPEVAATVPGDRVPPGSLVVLGDNARASIDSRELGLVPADRVLGVALRRYTRPPADPPGWP